MMNSFQPTPGATVNINVSSSSQSTLIGSADVGDQIRVMNDGTATVWVRFGPSTVTATTSAGMPIPSGAVEVFTRGGRREDALYVAAIAAGSTGKIYFTPGNGV